MSAELTRIIDGSEKPWLPMPGYEGSFIKVLVADRERGQVVFMFKMAPGAVFPEHNHHCHAIAYTTSGEWEYDEGKLPVGSMAYEVKGSRHQPRSGPGAEMVVALKSDDHRFLVNFPEGGEEFEMNMEFFESLVEITPEHVGPLRGHAVPATALMATQR